MTKKLTISGSVQVSNDLYLNDIKIDEYIRKHHLVYSFPCRVKGQQGYLYEIEYAGYSYEDALLWDFNKPNQPLSGGCSTFRVGNFIGRNFDWYFDKNVEFLVKSSNRGCHEVLGISAGLSITKEDMDKKRDLGDLYRIIPFYLVDGINDAGLVVSEHVVPHNPDFYLEEDKNMHNYGIEADDNSAQIPSLFLVRFILDHCKDLDEVFDYLKDKVITQAEKVIAGGYEVHFIVMAEVPCTKVGYEGVKSLIIEFRDSEVVILPCTDEDLYPVLTNFHITCPKTDSSSNREHIEYGPLTTESGKKRLSTPADAADGHYATIDNGIELMGQGLERYNILTDKIDSLEITNSKKPEYATMLTMTDIWYDKAYEGITSILDTEFTDGFTLTVDTPSEAYEDIKGRAKGAWERAIRQEHSSIQPWQTTHTSVYNIPERKLWVKTQNGAYQDVIEETPLVVVRSLEKIENKFVSPCFYDLQKAGETTCTCNFKGQHNEVYELCGGKYGFSDFVLTNDKTCFFKFSLGNEPSDVKSLDFPSEWHWLNAYTDAFVEGNTYSITLRRENNKYIAAISYEYT